MAADGERPGEGEDWTARRKTLEDKLAERNALRKAEAERQNGRAGSMQGMAEGLKLASEFAAGIIVGGGIGYVIDQAAGSSPFGLIVFLMLGFAAGIRNVLRSVSPPRSPKGDETNRPSDEK